MDLKSFIIFVQRAFIACVVVMLLVDRFTNVPVVSVSTLFAVVAPLSPTVLTNKVLPLQKNACLPTLNCTSATCSELLRQILVQRPKAWLYYPDVKEFLVLHANHGKGTFVEIGTVRNNVASHIYAIILDIYR